MISYIQRTLKSKKGFTLVELMVVVAIIGILVGIAVPAYSNITEKANKTACEANIRTIQGVLSMINAEGTEIPSGQETIAITATNTFWATYFTTVPTCPINETATKDYATAGTVGKYTVDTTDHVH